MDFDNQDLLGDSAEDSPACDLSEEDEDSVAAFEAPESETGCQAIDIYEWEPLPDDDEIDYIRVLAIDSLFDNNGPELKCSMHLTSLNHPTSYQALSYAWGSEKSSQEIFINGKSLAVTPTLKAALARVW